MVKLATTYASGAYAARLGGSTPPLGTNLLVASLVVSKLSKN